MKKVISLILALMLILPCFSGISVLAEGEITGTIKGSTLNIGESLTLDYYATFTVDSDDVTMKFTSSSGRITPVSGTYDDAQKMYKFSYEGINPQCMTDNIKAELMYNNTVLATDEQYSVKEYCDNQMTKTAQELEMTSMQYKAFRALLADMLVYGAAAQEYKEYNTANLASDSDWVKTFSSTFAKPVGVKEVSGNSDANNKVKSVGLNMANVNRIYFKLVLTDDVIVKLNGVEVSKSDMTENDDGSYTIYTEGIYATDFDKVYTIELIKDSNVISTVKYNTNAYIKAKYNDDTVGEIVKALCNYGISASAYEKAIKAETEGGDFNLDDEDILDITPNIIPEKASTFETATSFEDTGWSTFGTITTKELVEDDYGKCLHFVRDTSQTYHTPALNINSYITEPGLYTVTYDYKLKGANPGTSAFQGVMRAKEKTSFADQGSADNYFSDYGGSGSVANDKWNTYTMQFVVEASDFNEDGTHKGTPSPWRLGMHSFQQNAVTDIYIDNFVIEKHAFNFEYAQANKINKAKTWVSNELVLVSNKEYTDPFNDVDVDLTLTNGTTTYKVPGFWDGGNIWRVRFVCPTEGQWTYTTECTDEDNEGLHNVTNTLTCTKYSGSLDIYKRGFVKTVPGTKYFVYADGTPFFYLGDTHWSLGRESVDMVKTITKHRVTQGYTVWQSEPLGASFNFEDGITVSDVVLMQEFDEKFKIIADAGMVHTNAQFFLPSNMEKLIQNFGGYDTTKPYTEKLTNEGTEFTFYDLSTTAKEYLEKICRYWVARYSSYPVMWTLGQEVDNDYYWQRVDNHNNWSYVNNPYKLVAEYIGNYDPYNSPLSGHQEGHETTAASNSAFLKVEEHTWFAAQWKPSFNRHNSDAIAAAEDYWNNGQGKPVVNYEGMYCYLWTKDFGARAQGWMSFLSGMFGHGYGAQDTWSYLSAYDENKSKSDGVDTVTPEDKQNATWQDALRYESSYQVGYMKDFFVNIVGDWYNLIPRFDDTQYLERESESIYTGPSTQTTKSAFAYIASNSDSSKIVTYYYNFDNTVDEKIAETPNAPIVESYYGTTYEVSTFTGTYGKLQENTNYNYMWFNPRTGEVDFEGTFTSTSNGKWEAPEKAHGDMVLYIYKKG